jgi:beta-glucosidase
LESRREVYIPKRKIPASRDWFGNVTPEKIELPVDLELAKKYHNITDNPESAEFAIVFVKSPDGGTGYSKDDRTAGGNGYVPISLQYGPYTATTAREKSIASGDPVIDPPITNRSYKGKSVTAINHSDLQTILETRKAMGTKPVIVVIDAKSPMVFEEFEKDVDGIIVGFGVQHQAIFDVITGAAKPQGLLPVQMPANMATVEQQLEDVPHDMRPHVDSEGNAYDFGFGLNWNGVIQDKRTSRYKKTAPKPK